MSGISNKLKRKREESDTNDGLLKRRCVSKPPQNTPNSKNLANNRLKRLKESIQADLLSKNTKSPSYNLPSTSTACEKIASDLEYGKKSLREHQTTRKEKCISDTIKEAAEKSIPIPTHENKEQYNTVSKKNIANERLQRIKKSLQDSDKSKNKDKDKVSPSSSHRLENETVKDSQLESSKVVCSGRKRSLSNIFNADDELCKNNFQNKKMTTPQHTKLDKNLVNEIKYCNRNNLDSSKEESYTQKQITDAVDPCIKNCDKKAIHWENIICNDSEKVLVGNEKQDSLQKDVENIDSIAQASSLSSKINDSFSDKMAVTANWVLDQSQDLSCVTVDMSIYSGNSLSVNVDESATTLLNFDEEGMKMDWKDDSSTEEAVEPNVQDTAAPKKEQKLKDLCLIVDTNVFIAALQKIRDILNIKTPGLTQPIILIPWMVLEELDHLKESGPDAKLRKNAANSIIFINSMLEQKHSRIVGQSVHEAGNQMYIGKSPDDKILACCLQAAEKYENVILVSNDVNLKNKALINNIGACSSYEVIMKIKMTLSGNDKTAKITQKMGDLCSLVICECAKMDYEDVWTKMHMFQNPPWSLAECLHRFERYWPTMFSSRLLKQCHKTVEKLSQHLRSNKVIYDDSEEYVTLVKLCIDLCIYLRDIEECRAAVHKILNEVNNL